MVEFKTDPTARRRILLASIGAVAGAALYALFEILPDITRSPLLLTGIVTGTLAFFSVLLVAIGPLSPRRAGMAALTVAVPVATLMAWVTLRFHDLDGMMNAGHPVAAGALLVFTGTPFVIGGYDPNARWNDYEVLFSRAWEIVVRYAAAGAFTGAFWLLYLLSDTVLDLVGVGILRDVLEIDPVAPILTGATLGLGLAVVHELKHLISPKIVLRLLRLLLPPVVLVSAVFVLLVPVQGLSGVVSELSAGATVMAMALALISLITITIDRNAAEAAEASTLVRSAQAATVLALILAALGALAVSLRVAQYGWTPERLLAALCAAVFVGYGMTYTVATLRRAALAAARIRQANITMAVVTLALTALWLTPVLNAERLSARSQLARFEAGKTDAADLDLWRITHTWGRAGTRAFAPYRQDDHPAHDALVDRIAALDAGDLSPRTFEPQTSAEILADLSETLAYRPAGTDGTELLTALPEYTRLLIHRGCTHERTPKDAPACVGVVADFLPTPGDELLVIYRDGDKFETVAANGAYLELGTAAGPGLIDDILDGSFEMIPARGMELKLGDTYVAPLPDR